MSMDVICEFDDMLTVRIGVGLITFIPSTHIKIICCRIICFDVECKFFFFLQCELVLVLMILFMSYVFKSYLC